MSNKMSQSLWRKVAKIDNDQNNNYRQLSLVVNQIEDCKLGLFLDASCAGDLRDSKSTSGGLPFDPKQVRLDKNSFGIN